MLNLKQYRNPTRNLSDHIQWAFLIAPGIILNKDGSLMRVIRYRGPDLDSSTASSLVTNSRTLNNAIRRLGSGWSLYYDMERNQSREYPDGKFPDEASWLVDAERRAAFKAEGAHYDSQYHLTLQWMPPADRRSQAIEFFYDTNTGKAGPFERHLNDFTKSSDAIISLLEVMFPEVEKLDDNALLTYLHRHISPKQHPVKAPTTPQYLDTYLYDTPFYGGLSPRLGDVWIKPVSILGFPLQTEPGLLDALNGLGFAYRWCTRWICMDKDEAEKKLSALRRHWFSGRSSAGQQIYEALSNSQSDFQDNAAVDRANEADDALRNLGGAEISYGYLTTTVVVMDPDKDSAEKKVKKILEIINSRGFVAIEEDLNAVEAYLGSLPGHPHPNPRQHLVHSLNLAHLAPVMDVWPGPEKNPHLGQPLLMAKTQGTTPFRLSLHVGDVGHTCIVGPTGAGKSVLLGLLALQFRRYQGSQVFIFDKGGSSRATALSMNGASIVLSLDTPAALQPLHEIHKKEECSWALNWLVDILQDSNFVIVPEEKAELWEALQTLADAKASERTLSALYLLVRSHRLKTALQPFTVDGPLGALLDGEVDETPDNRIVHFELEPLFENKRGMAPVLSYLFHRMEQRFTGKPTLLILDEAWLFLGDPMFSGKIRDWLKTLRKKNVSVIFATQSLTDVAESRISSALIESCPSRIFLPNERALEPQIAEVYSNFGLNDQQIQLIAEALPKRDYYLSNPEGNRMFELGLGPLSLAILGASTPDDQKRIDRILKENPDTFFETFLREKQFEQYANIVSETRDETNGGSHE